MAAFVIGCVSGGREPASSDNTDVQYIEEARRHQIDPRADEHHLGIFRGAMRQLALGIFAGSLLSVGVFIARGPASGPPAGFW